MDQELLYINLVAPFTSNIYGDALLKELPGICLNNHDAILGYLISDVKDNNIEIPAHAVGSLINTYCRNSSSSDFSQIAFPLKKSTSPICVRTSSKLIFELVTKSFIQRLVEIKIDPDKIYYGCEGLILDKDLNPIMLCTIDIDRILCIESEVSLYAKSFNVRVSPKVFEKNDALSKYLINKIIPLFLSKNIEDYATSPSMHIPEEGLTPKIVIEDSSKFIVKPEVPDPLHFDEDISDFLKKKSIINEIVNAI